MNQSFRQDKKHFWDAVIWSPIFLGIMLTALSGSFVLPMARDRLLAGFVGYGFGFVSLAFFWRLLSYQRSLLVVEGRTFTKWGVFRRQQIDLAEVYAMVWQWTPTGGTIELYAPTSRLKLKFGDYAFADRLLLIEYLRAAIDRDYQYDWPIFCNRIALPLWQIQNSPKPNRGTVLPRALPRPGWKENLASIVALFALVYASFYALPRIKLPDSLMFYLILGCGLAFMVGLCCWSYRFQVKLRRWLEEQALESVQTWEQRKRAPESSTR